MQCTVTVDCSCGGRAALPGSLDPSGRLVITGLLACECGLDYQVHVQVAPADPAAVRPMPPAR